MITKVRRRLAALEAESKASGPAAVELSAKRLCPSVFFATRAQRAAENREATGLVLENWI